MKTMTNPNVKNRNVGLKDGSRTEAQSYFSLAAIVVFLLLEYRIISGRNTLWFPLIELSVPNWLLLILTLVFPMLRWLLPACFGIKQRSGWYRTAEYLIPSELIMALFLAQHHFVPVIVIFALSISCAALFFFELRKRGAGNRREMARCRSMANRLFLLTLSFLLLIPSFITFFHYDMSAPAEASTRFYTEKEQRDEGEPEIVEMMYSIDRGGWEELNVEAKTEILQRLLYFEARHLGLSDTPGLRITTTLSNHTLGAYSPTKKLVEINRRHLEDSSFRRVVHTLLHELYHYYCHIVVDLIDFSSPAAQLAYFDRARAWKNNAELYISSNTSLQEYMLQPLEVAAEAFADSEIDRITAKYPDRSNDTEG